MKLRLSNHLIVFALICLAPVILAVLVVGYDVAAIERQRVEDQTIALVRDYQGDIDAEVRSLIDVLEALATSPSIDLQDWTAFQQQTETVAAKLGAAIILRTPEGRHLVDTLVANVRDRDLVTVDPVLRRADLKATETKAPVLSDLYTDGTNHRHYVAVVAPVLRDGVPLYLLTLAITTGRIADKLSLGPLADDGWLAAVAGSDMRLVARTRDPETFVGTPVGAEITRAFSRSDRGVLQSRTLDGIDVFTAFQRTKMGWWVAVSAPRDVLHAPVRALVIVMVSIAGAVLTVTLVAAWTYGRMLGREVSTLSRNALAMGQNTALQPHRHHILEVADVQQALFDAQRKVEDLIAELNHRVKNTLTVIKVLAGRSVGSRRDRDAVSARISALTIAHEALTETHWRGANLSKLAQAVARSCDVAIICAGPSLLLEPKATVALAQVLQELVSNARQHGALRDRSGTIHLIWTVEGGVLQLEWQEKSPLRPQSPDHAAGFGLQVVELCVVRQLGGKLDIRTQPQGWTVVMSIPMSGELGTMARLLDT